MIQKDVGSDYVSRCTAALTTIRGVNRTDVKTLGDRWDGGQGRCGSVGGSVGVAPVPAVCCLPACPPAVGALDPLPRLAVAVSPQHKDTPTRRAQVWLGLGGVQGEQGGAAALPWHRAHQGQATCGHVRARPPVLTVCSLLPAALVADALIPMRLHWPALPISRTRLRCSFHEPFRKTITSTRQPALVQQVQQQQQQQQQKPAQHQTLPAPPARLQAQQGSPPEQQQQPRLEGPALAHPPGQGGEESPPGSTGPTGGELFDYDVDDEYGAEGEEGGEEGWGL